MNLMTEEIERSLNKFGLYGQENEGSDSKVLVKYFNPYGIGTWLITGGQKQSNGDWLLYGFISLTFNEWGYVRLSDLKSLHFSNSLPIIERDLYLEKNTTVKSECKKLGIRL